MVHGVVEIVLQKLRARVGLFPLLFNIFINNFLIEFDFNGIRGGNTPMKSHEY
jgi:hypothetical protein